MKKPDWVPSRVSEHRGKWTYRPPQTNRRVILCPVTASKQETLQAYNAAVEALKRAARKDVEAMIEGYLTSRMFTKLAAKSQRDYLNMAERWKKVLGHFMPDQVKPPMIVQIHEKMTESRGEVSADRHLSVLSRAFTWGRQRGWVELDPTKNLYIKNGTGQRDRYITDLEYLLVQQFANDILKSIMDVSYLCAARIEDVCALTHEQLLDEGILIKQGKTGVTQIKQWSPDLRKAIERVRSKTQSIKFVFHKQNGDRYSKRTIQAWYSKAKEDAAKHAIEKGIKDFKPDFTFHDIKAKGISDFEGDKQRFSGHKTHSQVAIYDRKVPLVSTVTNIPKKKLQE